MSDVQVTRVAGRTGSVEAVLLVRGDVEVSVDLAHARFESLDPQRRRAVLLLPHPRPGRARLDHGRTRLAWLGRTGLWSLVPGGAGGGTAEVRAVEESRQVAQETIAAAGGERRLTEQSRRQAEHVLAAFFRAAGWNVSIRWPDRPGT